MTGRSAQSRTEPSTRSGAFGELAARVTAGCGPVTVVIAVVFLSSIALTAVAAAVGQRRTDQDDSAEVLQAGA